MVLIWLWCYCFIFLRILSILTTNFKKVFLERYSIPHLIVELNPLYCIFIVITGFHFGHMQSWSLTAGWSSLTSAVLHMFISTLSDHCLWIIRQLIYGMYHAKRTSSVNQTMRYKLQRDTLRRMGRKHLRISLARQTSIFIVTIFISSIMIETSPHCRLKRHQRPGKVRQNLSLRKWQLNRKQKP